MSKHYLLLLNHLFHDYPLLAKKALETYPTQEQFTKNIDVTLRNLQVPVKKDDKIKTILRTFNAEDLLETLKKKDIHSISLYDREYPQLLKEIYDPPLILYAQGNIDLLNTPCMAVVGTRTPSDYGKTISAAICKDLSKHITIVSGMAKGIDAIAHNTALTYGGYTIGVLGSGINIHYPSENKDLYAKMLTHGCLITEHPLNTPSLPIRFPARNRLVSGLSKGVLICQALIKSGSLITARTALEQNRDVFAIPGPINDPLSEGGHSLIKDGAILVQNSQDILSEYHIKSQTLPFKTIQPQRTLPPLNENEAKIVDALKQNITSIDALLITSKLPIHTLLQELTLLECKGIIKEESSQTYALSY
jgi:DNA processing protein